MLLVERAEVGVDDVDHLVPPCHTLQVKHCIGDARHIPIDVCKLGLIPRLLLPQLLGHAHNHR